jgi:hypothetical protein
MSAAHTPGPWAILPEGTPHGEIATVYNTPDGWVSIHAPTWLNIGDQQVAMANARLIAAAPDLLDALRIARDHIDMDALEVSHCKDAERIRSAIAKATGEIA